MNNRPAPGAPLQAWNLRKCGGSRHFPTPLGADSGL